MPKNYIQFNKVVMRELEDISSPVVSEAFYGEEIAVLKTSGNYLKIKTLIDGYEGWILKDALVTKEKVYPNESFVQINVAVAPLYAQNDISFSPVLFLPFEVKLELVEEVNERWLKVRLLDEVEVFLQKGHAVINKLFLSPNEVCQLSLKFQNLAYLWGGRTGFGYDCSGFVQMLYRQMHIFLPRDSKDQHDSPLLKEVEIDNLLPGDLLFFGENENNVSHVGFCLENGTFIHATISENLPFIRISHLDEPLWNKQLKFKYRSAKRSIAV